MLRKVLTVSGWTGASRILGMIRDLLFAAFLGAGPVAEAFFIAFRLPNMFRRIFAEGAYAAAFIPLLADAKNDPDGGQGFARQALSWLTLVLIALSVIALIWMPGLVRLLAPGFETDAAKFAQAVLLSRITFAYLLFMAVTAHFSAVLNSLEKFAAAAAAPVLLNIFFIIACLVILPFTDADGYVLAWTAAISGIAQVILVALAVRRAGWSVLLEFPRRSARMGRLVMLMIPGIISAGVIQINLIVGTRLVSDIEGAVAWLSYADRLYQLPLGLIGIAFGIVLLPDLSAKLKAGENAAAQVTLNRALGFAMLVTIPAATALLIIPEPVIALLYERGAFSAADRVATAQTLAMYALGLPAFVLMKLFLPAFFARQDTRTPMIFAFISMIVNVAAALLLIGPMGFTGVALATTLAAYVNLALLIGGQVRRENWSPDRQAIRTVIVSLAGSGVMAAVLIAGLRAGSGQALWLQALLLIPAGSLLYGAVCFGAGELRRDRLLSVLRR